ncbi:MAG: hypothetical protein RMK84_11030 [Oscillochloridaceae bacterium]|nr:hypothetical protein [Chloroflexaceae bacterium]MDW8390647.1 hypothetical protein [Oscillochloridaceae bacterium]
MDTIASFRDRLGDPRRFLLLYGATPPRADASPERSAELAERLAARLGHLPLDGVVVYDVQDESGRTSEPRPFPFFPASDPRAHACRLQALTGLPAISYKCVTAFDEGGWLAWLDETVQHYQVAALSLVGAATPTPPPGALAVDRALRLAKRLPGAPPLGGVVIAERHSPAYDESQRLLHKAAAGCDYFISQIVYQSEPTIRLLRDYLAACAREGVAPKRIVLTFAPCGRPKTAEFLRWLGVAMAPETERTILADPAPFRRSIQICCDHLRAILEQDVTQCLPLGINVESVSNHPDEMAAALELLAALREVATRYRAV